jgi:hypothetical protein
VTSAKGRNAALCFNYDNARTTRWSEPVLQAQWGFTTRYPAEGTSGIRLELPEVQP